MPDERATGSGDDAERKYGCTDIQAHYINSLYMLAFKGLLYKELCALTVIPPH